MHDMHAVHIMRGRHSLHMEKRMKPSVICPDCKEPIAVAGYECQECCEHDYDPDEGYSCLNCGKSGEDYLASRIDDAMDRMKYGDD